MQIVSLTTDFGLTDYYVGELKACILSQVLDVKLVDICHQLEPYDIVQGALYVKNTYSRFPKGSIHIAAVQNYYAKVNEMVVFERDGHYFIGPNNGIFSLIWPDLDGSSIYRISVEDMDLYGLPQILAHAVAFLAHRLPLADIGPVIERLDRKMSIQPVVTSDQIRATIIHIDRFDNAIVNLERESFERLRAGRQFVLYFKHDDPIHHFSKHYAEVPVGEALAMWNTSGYLQVSVNMGKASTLYNLKKNETIQIYFRD